MADSPARAARILVVDDEATFTTMLETVLRMDGFVAVQCVNDAREAPGVFITFRPDIVLLDLNMPHSDGLALIAEFRELAQSWTPIVVISGDNDGETITRALQAGAHDFVGKPFRRLEMLTRIRNIANVKLLQAAVEDQNRNLQERVEERTRELADSHRDLIRRLGRCGEYRDDETGQHVMRVSRTAELLGKEAKLPAEHADNLRDAAAMHDIGKVGIPDRILLKPGKLTPEEFETMKTHTVLGATLLSGGKTNLLQLAEQVAMSHHERWDGKGYPAGMGGADIPLAARIVSICDVFDALTSRRPYKEPWPIEKAKAEILAQSGKQFDPDVVALFVSRWEEVLEIRERFPEAEKSSGGEAEERR